MNKKKAMEVFDGLMLGDGGLRRLPNTALYSQSQCKPGIPIESHLLWLCWLRDNVFAVLGIRATVRTYWGTYAKGLKKGQKYQFAALWTECSSFLAELYDEWYTGGTWREYRKGTSIEIHNATKIVPKRLMEITVLPALSLAHWFFGDGGSSRHKNSLPTIDVSLSTHCFSEGEVHCLTVILNNMGIKTIKPHRQKQDKGAGLQIRLAQSSIDYFMSLIEPHTLEIFGGSLGSSYKDMIKYKYTAQPDTPCVDVEANGEFNNLRSRLARVKIIC